MKAFLVFSCLLLESIMILFIPLITLFLASLCSQGRRCLSGPFGAICPPEDKSSLYSDNTLEDIVINRRKDKICVKERVKPLLQTRPPQTPPPEIYTQPTYATPPPYTSEQTLPPLFFSTRKPLPSKEKKCVPGVSSCRDFYAKNTLEDIVINRRRDRLCVKSQSELEALK